EGQDGEQLVLGVVLAAAHSGVGRQGALGQAQRLPGDRPGGLGHRCVWLHVKEALIAYVKEDLQSRFLSANRAALRILGIKPEEVAGMVGMSLVPDTSDARRRVQEAFASVGRGTDTRGAVLEFRRRDNGKPVWVQ